MRHEERIWILRGAEVNGRADIDANGIGGQTPVFHAASQFYDFGLPMVEFLVAQGADLALRAKVPGHYERLDEFVECNAAEYGAMFPGTESATLALLRRHVEV